MDFDGSILLFLMKSSERLPSHPTKCLEELLSHCWEVPRLVQEASTQEVGAEEDAE